MGLLVRLLGTFRGRLAASVLSGVLVFLSFPALDLSQLAWVALVPWMLALRQETSLKRVVFLSWIAGFVTNLGGFYWIVGLLEDFAYLPFIAALPVHLLLCAQQALVFTLAGTLAWWATSRGAHALFAWPAALVASETIIPLIFPWYFANSQGPLLSLIQTAELGGVWLVSGWLVLVNVMCAEALALRAKLESGERRQISRRAWAIGVTLALLNPVYGAVRVAQEDARADAAESVRIGMVQGNIGIFSKGQGDSVAGNLVLHQRMSRQLQEEGAELIIWPETAYMAASYPYSTDTDIDSWSDARRRQRLAAILPVGVTWLPRSPSPLPPADEPPAAGRVSVDSLAPQRGFDVPLLVGVLLREALTPEAGADYPSYTDQPRQSLTYNSVLLLDGDGRVEGRADKIRLMPFGESVPFARALYRFTGINLLRILPQVSDFEPGDEVVALPYYNARTDSTFRLGMMICYEDILPSFGRLVHAHRPHVLINQTNDAWFGDSAEPWLHQTLAAFRTVEQRTWLLRSVNTGVTGVIDNVGRIREQTPTWQEALVLHEVAMLEARTTPYMLLGNWPGTVAFAWFLGIVFGAWRQRRISAG